MSGFLTKLCVELVDQQAHGGRGSWKLMTPLVYQSDVAGLTITVPPGYTTDFASVPRAPILFLAMGDKGHMAAVIHDWLYTTKPPIMYRLAADNVFREALIASGMPKDEAEAMYLGVRFGGANHFDSGLSAVALSPQEPLLP